MHKQRWILQTKKADFYALAQKFSLDPVTIRLLVNRGADTEEKIRRYLYGSRKDLYSPRLLKDAEKAAEKIAEAVRQGKKILIAADYDADGVLSGRILWEGIRRLGGEVSVLTPDRASEGYGLNTRMVETAEDLGIGLIVTCDNGIAAFDAAQKARELGIPLIITDHHAVPFETNEAGEKAYRIPEAEAVVDPAQEDCPYPAKTICGAAVAWKLVCLLYEISGIDPAETDPLLELAAIATVTDVCPLTDENRILVREGLSLLHRTARPGLRALAAVNSIEIENLNTYHLGFVFGPCLNAAGRLSSAEDAFRLLAAEDETEAMNAAVCLKKLNESRKSTTEKAVKAAVSRLDAEASLPDVLLLHLPDCPEYIAGIVAGKLKEKYHHPAIVMTGQGEELRGSGRSIEGYDLFAAISPQRDRLLRFGGHPMAVGLTVPSDYLAEFDSRLNRDTGLREEDFRPVVYIDAAMPLGYITEDLIREFELLEPSGTGNPSPLFAEKFFRLCSVRPVGKTRTFYRMTVENAGGCRIDGIYFGDAEEFSSDVIARWGQDAWNRALAGRENPICLMLVYHPSIHEFRGMRDLEIVIEAYDFPGEGGTA